MHGVDTRPVDNLNDALDATVRDSLRPVSTGLGVLFAVLAVGHALVLPRAVMPVMVSFAAGTAVALLGLRVLLNRWTVPLQWVNPLGAAIAGLALLNSLAHLYLVSARSWADR